MTYIAVFIAGYLLCYLHSYTDRRKAEKLFTDLRDDYRQLVNEVSIRTGGRVVYKPEKKDEPLNEPELDRGEFSILTPSMAEAEAMEDGEVDETLPVMSMADLEHLRSEGILR